nr:putative reverse transcriptase domain-containing protein [Tanacetum cinerariifolium]
MYNLTDISGSNGANDNLEGCTESCGKPSRDRNVKDDNKKTRTGNAFDTTINPVRRDYTSAAPKCANSNLHHSPESPYRACFNCNRLEHLAKDYRVVPRMVNLVDARNLTSAHGACFACDCIDHFKAACPRLNHAQRPRRNCPNQVVAINEGQEIEGHVFDIDLIPFEHGSFDMIIGMDWFSKHKAEIIFHEKVARIPQQKGKVLRVIRERPEEKVRHLMSAKSKEHKHEEIVVVRDFLKVFLNDLSGLPPTREIKFHTKLPWSNTGHKSPYRLAPSEMEELSGQLRELHDKGFI